MFRIAHNHIEINDAIKGAAGSDPFVYRLACCFLYFRVIAGDVHALTRGKRRADHFDSTSVRARNQLPVRISDILSAARLGWIGKILTVHFCTGKADVVNTFQEHNVTDTGQSENVAVEPRKSTNAEDVTTAQQSIANDTFIDHR